MIKDSPEYTCRQGAYCYRLLAVGEFTNCFARSITTQQAVNVDITWLYKTINAATLLGLIGAIACN